MAIRITIGAIVLFLPTLTHAQTGDGAAVRAVINQYFADTRPRRKRSERPSASE